MNVVEMENDDFSYNRQKLLYSKSEIALFETQGLIKISLNEIVAAHNSDKSNLLIPQAITYRHEISAKAFYIMQYAFWVGEKTIYYKQYDKVDVEHIANYSEDYLRYNPDSSRTGYDIDFDRIMISEWHSTTSCYPIAMFREINRRMEEGDKLKLFKGYDFIDDGNGRYNKETVILFELQKANGTSYYFDISDDPGN